MGILVYNRAGSMTANIRVGAYAYGATRPRHAPVSITNGTTVTTLTYDANGNMLTGLDGKVMSLMTARTGPCRWPSQARRPGSRLWR